MTTTTPERVEVEQRDRETVRLIVGAWNVGDRNTAYQLMATTLAQVRAKCAGATAQASAAEIERLKKAISITGKSWEKALAAAEAESARLREALKSIEAVLYAEENASWSVVQIIRAALADVSKQEVVDHG